MRKTPGNSNKRRNRKKEGQENIIALSIFLIFVVAVAYIFYFVNTSTNESNVVATVNGNEITIEDLDWWYRISILPEFRDTVTKTDFLILSLIPQEVLIQKADEEKIKATEDDVENLIGNFVIEEGINLDELENILESRGFSIDDLEKSFETRAIIIKLFEKENFDFELEFFSNSGGRDLQSYVDDLIDNSEIEFFQENIEKLVLISFDKTEDDLCDEGRPILRLYTTSWCQVCNGSIEVFEDVVVDYIEDGSASAVHWSLDTGDDMLTIEKESGVPAKEVELFKKYSPKNLVPTVVLGCKYKRVGEFGIEDKNV